ncbi:hypothetical protein SAMN04244572_03461 [Azotobacter beijerinckii]|uniref:Uncharacterized protein n=1 Tax=Azotobacter beijerinckii TaxID=170623 RepID=A0A1H6XLJ5_9GAMM|nr:hypothetical protein SAMN04244572_03461 [Azotobacter beijerinckii]
MPAMTISPSFLCIARSLGGHAHAAAPCDGQRCCARPGWEGAVGDGVRAQSPPSDRACRRHDHRPVGLGDRLPLHRPGARLDASGCRRQPGCMGKAAFWPSTGTEFPSAGFCCRAGNKDIICNPPAWPSGPARMISTSWPAMGAEDRAPRSFTPRCLRRHRGRFRRTEVGGALLGREEYRSITKVIPRLGRGKMEQVLRG